ncbi:MAG: hypothetical protein M1814_000406 [Vezdaea aestivalis]|nr:MAG: hypothetical protein M1814_000406 [Vezdaea aestivalis]
MLNLTIASDLPTLPSYSLSPRPPLIPGVPDKAVILLLPILAYWVVSMLFHWIDVKDYFAQYRLHTPAEILKRNRVSRYDVVKDVVIQQIIQTIVGAIINLTEPEDMVGMREYDISVWAMRLRIAQSFIPSAMALIGFDSRALAAKLQASSPYWAGALNGGLYPIHVAIVDVRPDYQELHRTFTPFELSMARALYWYIVPVVQFIAAIIILDTWQYFLHRAMHMNQWLYRTFHSRHHRLYVPYAFGALYNHPFEGFLLDTCGAGLAFKLTSMTTRQGIWFFTASTIKTVDDHCGYALPFDPLQLVTSNNAAYHDIHHQSWGIKTNFSQPFFTFWDGLMGTKWRGGDVKGRYDRAKKAAQLQFENDQKAQNQENTDVKEETEQNEQKAAIAIPTSKRTPQKRARAHSASLKGLKDRVSGSMHGRGGGVLGMD